MSSEVLKVEAESSECCAVCGGDGAGGLRSPEEHDAAMPPGAPPLRSVLLHLAHNKAIPSGPVCATCAVRASDAYELSMAISARSTPPLSDKIRALRKRLHDLTQKIDVFIVVGSQTPDSSGGGGAYSEEDIIMVERAALAAAAADEHLLERGADARGAPVYQCTVCPETFQRASEFRSHCAAHPASARHSCWSCGAMFETREAALRHAAALHQATAGGEDKRCHLCEQDFQSGSALRAHSCPPRCPLCAFTAPSVPALSAHVAARHGGEACALCFRRGSPTELAAHAAHHRRPRHFICGYDNCILRFATRNTLMSHIRKCHGEGAATPGEGEARDEEEGATASLPRGAGAGAGAVQCEQCYRTFGSRAAMKRHARVHRTQQLAEVSMEGVETEAEVEGEEVEYLEVETLEEHEPRVQVEMEEHDPGVHIQAELQEVGQGTKHKVEYELLDVKPTLPV